MITKIFLSHASSETEQASKVADLLKQAGLEPVIDNHEIRAGDSFISFMDQAIINCDYCLLLWSRAASKGRWVTEEWQSAYYRSVTTNQSFLVIGRLEELDPPPMLRPRSWIELFPTLDPGIEKLVALWRYDEAAAEASNRPVCPPRRPLPAASSGKTVYISSKVFGKTFPLEVDFESPTAAVTDRIILYLDAPRRQDHKGMLGCRYEYSLSDGRETLDAARSLKAQNIAEKSLLWLEVEITPFAAGENVGHNSTGAIFRGGFDEARRDANAALLKWSQQVGLAY
jgi:TIR domain